MSLSYPNYSLPGTDSLLGSCSSRIYLPASVNFLSVSLLYAIFRFIYLGFYFFLFSSFEGVTIAYGIKYQ